MRGKKITQSANKKKYVFKSEKTKSDSGGKKQQQRKEQRQRLGLLIILCDPRLNHLYTPLNRHRAELAGHAPLMRRLLLVFLLFFHPLRNPFPLPQGVFIACQSRLAACCCCYCFCLMNCPNEIPIAPATRSVLNCSRTAHAKS